jgi:hypothetical protein
LNGIRRFHRIPVSAKTTVYHLDHSHDAVLGAISLGGAAINFNEDAMIPQQDECIVAIVFEENQPPLLLKGLITNSSFFRIGVKFIDMDEEKIALLYGMLKKLTDEPEKLESELSLLIALA